MMLFYTEKEVLSGEDIFDSLGLKEALHPTSADYQQDAKQVLDFLNQICTYSREKKLNMSDGIREFLNGMALGTIESPEDILCRNHACNKSPGNFLLHESGRTGGIGQLQ